MTKIAIVLGSIRDGRVSPQVGEWVKEIGNKRKNVEFEIVDLKEFEMPLFYKRFSEYDGTEKEYENLKRLSEITQNVDGFVFITPEYNHGLTSVMKNYFDLFYAEFNNKAAGIVSYGSSMGARAGEQVRDILAELQVADVRQQVSLSLFADFEGFVNFKPLDIQEGGLETMLDQVVAWTDALAHLRK